MKNHKNIVQNLFLDYNFFSDLLRKVSTALNNSFSKAKLNIITSHAQRILTTIYCSSHLVDKNLIARKNPYTIMFSRKH